MTMLKIIFDHISFAYPIIFSLMFIEGGDGTLLASGFLVRLGFLNFFIVYPLALLTALLRDIILYKLGARYGENLVAKFGRFLFITPAQLAKLEARLKNGGRKTIFFAKFLYGLNHITIMAVGATKFNFWKFLKIESVTIFLWGTLMLLLGFFLGHGFTLLRHYVKDIALLLTAVFALFIVLAEFGITSKVLLFYRSNEGKAPSTRSKIFQKGKLSIVILFIVLAVGVVAFCFRGDLMSGYRAAVQKAGWFKSGSLSEVMSIENVEKQILTPPPLRTTWKKAAVDLTITGVVDWTNQQRVGAGLASLEENYLLNLAAAAKARDMFEKQYFAHNSPDGRGPDELANEVGYDYIAIGENLALGNFDGDKALVEAWMESPGHRANILFGGYEEIGVAVIRGTFENQVTWIAVQEFGRPLADCPRVDMSLAAKINGYKSEITALDNAVAAKQEEIKILKPQNREEYEARIEEYNSLVNQYNNLVAAIKALVAEYNLQVSLFNQCASPARN
ncbi:MAG: hypothetical protein CO002_02480 [Candidatus Portnoybacteria bacterium CG_4_8_14_3_um_filter_44_10]|uniref:Uncharacterized protein n=2 Tax=Candidatus Portnoyibacteriota TaxID=1817913 RepID=A0A2H0WWQ1_9BACT|nr:MAG: hypothetical protein COT61_00860 [Candidatus Portnoybacteria bacterium CG09_land_8_20_14_0_10_44_13]PIW75359.1 MAG: hypothetical protein CO002_02480 [Candidatus Portnoybacteria bacterium CG_4_8_14_3_um_filter_44_10]